MPEDVHCSLCGPAPKRILYVTRERPPFKEDNAGHILPQRIWNQCLVCGLNWLSPRLTADEATALYTEEYHDQHHEELRGWEFYKKKNMIEKYVSGGKLLDIGCGYGYFLYSLGREWSGTGVELSEAACRTGHDRLGVDIKCGTTETLTLPPESFDAVTLWDVLEHLPDPAAELRRAHALLRPGGALGLSTCDAAATVPSVARKYWYCINTPDHQYAFTLDWLRRAIEATGFEFREYVIHNAGWMFLKPFAARLAKETVKSALGFAARATHLLPLERRLEKYAAPLVPMYHDLVIIVAIKK